MQVSHLQVRQGRLDVQESTLSICHFGRKLRVQQGSVWLSVTEMMGSSCVVLVCTVVPFCVPHAVPLRAPVLNQS